MGNAPLIDVWLGKLWDCTTHYWTIVVRAPSSFERHHWIILSVVCLTIGCLSMRGFGSRKDF